MSPSTCSFHRAGVAAWVLACGMTAAVAAAPAPNPEPPLATAAAPAASPAPQKADDIDVRASADRTAVWVGDHVTYTIDIVCRRGVDILEDDLSRDKLKLDGFDLVGSEATRQTGRDDTTTHRFRYELTTYKVDQPVLRIAPLTVRYYVKRAGQRLEDAAPAGEVAVPGTTIAFRSMLPDEERDLAVRDGRAASARPAFLMFAAPAGVGLIVASFAPAGYWLVRLVRDRRRRTVRKSARQTQREERASLDAVRALDLGTPDARREAYARINTLVREHLCDACGIPAPSLTTREIEPALASTSTRVPAGVVTALLAACERATYGPPSAVPSADACRDAMSDAEQVLAAR